MDVIGAATAVAARCVGREAHLSTIAVGKHADSLAVSGDPVQDLRALAMGDDMAVGVGEALVAAGRDGKTGVVGIDAIPDGAAAIPEGQMLASADLSGHDQAGGAKSADVGRSTDGRP